ncbi:AMP-binding protein [Nocardia sp. 348MFTsu5.1]|uniref:AMP-binding protein n=1 Tax=Nocardia sp. 348MFTsu5.1 TaxID=1172185 RepID=UPI00037A36BE|nr:AMP-binding protein [Nocardia sp. 348MFTsu5.1]
MITTHAASLQHLLAELIELDPDATLTYDVVDGAPVSCSRAQFGTRVECLSHELTEVGLRSGQCVAVLLPNWSDALVWQFAAASIGAHVIGLNTRYNTAEVAHILTSARPAVVAVALNFHGLDLFGTLSTAVTATPSVAPPVVAVVAGPDGNAEHHADLNLGSGHWFSGSSDINGARVPDTPDTTALTPAGRSVDDMRLAVAFTTSGSTGTPKLAAHSESGVVRHARADAAIMGVVPGDVALCVLPVSGVFGYSLAMAMLAGGGALLMVPVFDARDTLRRMTQLQVTHCAGGDDLFGRLYDTWHSGEHHQMSALRWIGIADFLGRSGQIAAWLRDEFGTQTTGVFGSSEVFALALLWRDTDPEDVRWNGGGRPVDTAMTVRIADPVTDTVVPEGEQGELQFRGPNVVDAYLGNPDASANAFTRDGWFRSGDLGVATGDGGYTYVCRMGDALRLRGFLVDPAEIEHRLAQHPDVHTAKVVGITDAAGYTQAVGFVVPAETDSDDAATTGSAELRTWCAQTLAAFKVPSAIHIINAMPTTVGGNGTKIRAVVLRDYAQQWSDRERDFRHD